MVFDDMIREAPNKNPFLVVTEEGYTEPLYNPNKDIAPVSQDGFIDLCAALAGGSIPSDISSVVPNGEECDDPSKLLPKYGDVFEKLHQLETVKALSKASDASD